MRQRNNRLFTLLLTIALWLLTIKLHICMLWLTFIMRKPAFARRAIAIEFLRRIDQLDSYRRRSSSASDPRQCYVDVLHSSPQHRTRHIKTENFWASARAIEQQSKQSKQPKQAVCETSFASRRLASRADDGTSQPNVSARLDTVDQNTVEGSLSDCTPLLVLRCALADSSPKDRQHIDRPRSRTKRRRREQFAVAEAQVTPPTSPSRKTSRTYNYPVDQRQPTRQSGGERRIITPRSKPTIRSRPFHLRSDSGLSACDTPPFGKYPLPSLRSSEIDVGLQDDTTEGAEEDCPDTRPSATVGGLNAFHKTPVHNHLRSNSVDSATTTIRRATPVTLRSQSKANGGLLQLRASTSRPRESTPTRIHRRNISLNVPIRPTLAHSDSYQQVNKRWSTSTTIVTQACLEEPFTPTRTEAELQYKHRHIFVGTASLHSFLSLLETSPFGGVSRHAIMKAYTHLASKEQLLARQRSQSNDDWHLVTRITADISEFDYITLARVQLGSVSLQHFVDAIPFDRRGEAPLAVVVEAFKNASHVDAEEDRENGGKQSTFRRWLLSQDGDGD